MNYDEFERKYIGVPVDFDGVAGVQCVDLVDQYLKDCFGITDVWVQGAKDIYNNFSQFGDLVANFDRIPNTPDLVVNKGDIIVWGGGSWGHTGIGNGQGNKRYFVSLEENTLGNHEPTQLVKHYFDNDVSNPVLGVLRPKTAAKVLDKVGYTRGDKDIGVYFLKATLKALGYKLDDTSGFGSGTLSAVNDILSSKNYIPNGIAGKGFADLVVSLIK